MMTADESLFKSLNLKPLGWICTQPNALLKLSSKLIMKHGSMIAKNSFIDTDKFILMTCSLTPASCLLETFRLTPIGYEKSRQNVEEFDSNNLSFYERLETHLTEKMLGFFVTPESWNYYYKSK